MSMANAREKGQKPAEHHWMLGGDRPLEKRHRVIIDAMASGIKSSGDNTFDDFPSVGGHNSTEYLCDADYIDFHTAQTTTQC